MTQNSKASQPSDAGKISDQKAKHTQQEANAKGKPVVVKAVNQDDTYGELACFYPDTKSQQTKSTSAL